MRFFMSCQKFEAPEVGYRLACFKRFEFFLFSGKILKNYYSSNLFCFRGLIFDYFISCFQVNFCRQIMNSNKHNKYSKFSVQNTLSLTLFRISKKKLFFFALAISRRYQMGL